MRIVSICPSNTELLAYLGLTSSIVGIDNYSDWPESVHSLPRLGPDLDINMDEVQRLNPDLVVASLSVPGMEKNIERLEERGLPYIVLNPNSLEEIGENLLLLGEVTNTMTLAKDVHQKYFSFIEQYRTLSHSISEKPKIYWEWWAKPVFTPGGKNWLTEISELAGTINIFADTEQASIQTDWDTVYRKDPDHICLVWVGVKKERVKPELVLKRPDWTSLDAVKQERVHILDEPLFCRPSPRLLTGLQKFASLIHPNVYPQYVEGQEWL